LRFMCLVDSIFVFSVCVLLFIHSFIHIVLLNPPLHLVQTYLRRPTHKPHLD